MATDRGGDHRAGSRDHANLQLFERHVPQSFGLFGRERVARELLYGREQARDHVRVLRGGRGSHDVAENQSRFAMNQENLFNTINQTVHQHYFRERSASAEGFNTPPQPLPGQAVLEGLVE